MGNISVETGVKVPRNLFAAGRNLWRAATGAAEFGPHELSLLEEACRVRDKVVALDAIVKEEGIMKRSSQGPRVHPAMVEARQQRLVFARLVSGLKLPDLEDEDA